MKMGKYLCEYKPDHPKATSEGYVYTHIIKAEEKLGRYLKENECVHHIDENKYNNALDNLIVFKTKADHTAYHKGCEIYKEGDVYVAKKYLNNICPVCGGYKDFKANTCIYCRKSIISNNIPSKEFLENYIGKFTFVQIGKMFNVSDNAVRKWCKKYHLPYKKSEIINMNI